MADDKLSRRHLVLVFWNDAHGAAIGEFSEEEIAQKSFHSPAPIKTWGLLVRDDEKGIMLAMEETGEPGSTDYTHYRGMAFIPRGMVARVIDFGIPRMPKVKSPSPRRRTSPKGKAPKEQEVATSANNANEPLDDARPAGRPTGEAEQGQAPDAAAERADG